MPELKEMFYEGPSTYLFDAIIGAGLSLFSLVIVLVMAPYIVYTTVSTSQWFFYVIIPCAAISLVAGKMLKAADCDGDGLIKFIGQSIIIFVCTATFWSLVTLMPK